MTIVGTGSVIVSTIGSTIIVSGGNTTGPASSISGTVAIFADTSGKLLSDANTLLYSPSLASFSEGSGSTATGAYSHAEGQSTFVYAACDQGIGR